MSIASALMRGVLSVAVERTETSGVMYRVIAHMPVPDGKPLNGTKMLAKFGEALRREPTESEVSPDDALLYWDCFTWGEARIVQRIVLEAAEGFGVDPSIRIVEAE